MKYITPECEILEFNKDDIITSSPTTNVGIFGDSPWLGI